MIKRYAIGFFDKIDEIENPEYAKAKGNKLVSYICKNTDKFELRYICHDKEKIRTWIIIDTKELYKAKDYFKDDGEVLKLINLANEKKLWNSACKCCGSISLNTIPYTYRNNGGSIGKSYECVFCAGFQNKYANNIRNVKEKHGIEAAIDLLLEYDEQNND